MTNKHTEAQWKAWERSQSSIKGSTDYLTKYLEPGEWPEIEDQLPPLVGPGFWYAVLVKEDVVAHIRCLYVDDDKALMTEPFALPWADSSIAPLLYSLAATRLRHLGRAAI